MAVGRPTGTTKLELEPEIAQRFLSFIRAGAYAWVAAESAGIGSKTFHRWMEQGEADEAADRQTAFRQFRQDVRQARADARTAAEVEVRKAEPLAWLRYGPGRERPGEPGWTVSGEEGARDAVTILIMGNGITPADDGPVGKPTQVIDVPALPSPKVKVGKKPRSVPTAKNARRHLDQRPAR